MKDKKKLNPWQLEKDLDRIGSAGVWTSYDPGTGEAIAVKIGSVEAPLYHQALEGVMESARGTYKNRVVPEDVTLKYLNKVYSLSILLDWQSAPKDADGNDQPHMVDEKGAPLPYSNDAAERVLAGMKRFREFVVAFAGTRRNFVAALEDEAEKNLLTASFGASNGGAVASNSEKPQ